MTHFSKMQAGDHTKSSCKALEQQPHDGSQQQHPEQLRRKADTSALKGLLLGCLSMLTGNSSVRTRPGGEYGPKFCIGFYTSVVSPKEIR